MGIKRSNSATWMSQAAERDGAEISWLTKNTFIAVKNGIELMFIETRCLDTQPARRFAADKGLAKHLFLKHSVPTPKGAVCETVEDALKFRAVATAPIVIKPTIGIKGKGVSVGVDSPEDVRKACIRAGIGKSLVLAEEMVSGTEYRVMVLGGKPIAALYKDPANIIGNGVSNILSLIRQKNKEREKNPNLAIYKIKVDDYVKSNIAKQGLDLETVLPEGQKIYLRKEGNLSAGGESIDVTDDLPEFVYASCVKAANSFPGLELAGVDVFYDIQTKECHILEVNTNPGCGGHLFPHIGKPRNVTDAIWRYSYNLSEGRARLRAEHLLRPSL